MAGPDLVQRDACQGCHGKVERRLATASLTTSTACGRPPAQYTPRTQGLASPTLRSASVPLARGWVTVTPVKVPTVNAALPPLLPARPQTGRLDCGRPPAQNTQRTQGLASPTLRSASGSPGRLGAQADACEGSHGKRLASERAAGDFGSLTRQSFCVSFCTKIVSSSSYPVALLLRLGGTEFAGSSNDSS